MAGMRMKEPQKLSARVLAKTPSPSRLPAAFVLPSTGGDNCAALVIVENNADVREVRQENERCLRPSERSDRVKLDRA
jgi:hypothetical protein